MPPPLLSWWQGRVDCMLWYALSRNLWMCRSIIAILYLNWTRLFATSSSSLIPRSVHSKVLKPYIYVVRCLGTLTFQEPFMMLFRSGWGLVALSESQSCFFVVFFLMYFLLDHICRGEAQWHDIQHIDSSSASSTCEQSTESYWRDPCVEAQKCLFKCMILG